MISYKMNSFKHWQMLQLHNARARTVYSNLTLLLPVHKNLSTTPPFHSYSGSTSSEYRNSTSPRKPQYSKYVLAVAVGLSAGCLMNHPDLRANLVSCVTEMSQSLVSCVTEMSQSLSPVVHAATPHYPTMGGGDIGSEIPPESPRSKFNFIADIVEKVSPAVVSIEARSRLHHGSGSGFIFTPDGLIVTNAHVVRSARNHRVQVKLVDGRSYEGIVQVVDSASDLALVKIEDIDLPTVKLGSSKSLRPGEWVVAVGSPLTLTNTVTSGIVSSIKRSSQELGLHTDIDYIQTDAPITFGNSGGPLINLDGEAVGVNSMKVTDGISFAIPSDYVQQFLQKAEDFKLTVKSKRRSTYIGIRVLSLTPAIAAQLRMREELKSRFDIDFGVFVLHVENGSPAAEAGLKRFDVITKIDGQTVETATQVFSLIESKKHAVFTVYRNGRTFDITVKPSLNDYD